MVVDHAVILPKTFPQKFLCVSKVSLLVGRNLRGYVQVNYMRASGGEVP